MKKFLAILFLVVSLIQLSAYSYGKNKVQKKQIDWSKIETLHFDIYFDKSDEEFGHIVTLMAEEAYYYLKRDLRVPIKDRIPIIFYPSHHDFETTNIIYPLLNEAVGGFTETARNRVAVPFDGSYQKMEEILIHELTHAYLNSLNNNSIKLVEFSNLPFWFSEGFPEYQSVQGESVYNNMFIIDMLFNEYLYDIELSGGYLAYRQGESFLTYISEKYGRDKVIELFYALKSNTNSDDAFKKVFDLKLEDVQEKWKIYLKKKYYPKITEFDMKTEVYDQKTFHKKDGSYMNYAPRFSPDGNNYIYFSNRKIRNSIWKGSTLDLYKSKKILTGESSGNFQEFHFRRNNLSWFPDGESFAFVSKTVNGDAIYIMDFKNKKILNKVLLKQFDAIYEIDVSSDGEKLTFAAQKGHKNDIYIFNLNTSEITQLTDDRYYDSQPCWSPDGSKIAFSSERTANKKNKHVSYSLVNNIFYYDLEKEKFYQVTNDDFNNYFPIWTNDNNQIIMVTEREFVSNFEIVDLINGKRAKVTKSLGGVFTGDIDKSNENLIFSGFYEGGWNIYNLINPLKNMEYSDYDTMNEYIFIDDFYTKFDIQRYQVYGFKERKFRKVIPEISRKSITRIEIGDIAQKDSLNKLFNNQLDQKPEELNVPQIKPYKIRFSLDRIWGGMAYSASGGAYGQLFLSMSDLMGNHNLGFNFGVYKELKNSDFVFNYLYLARRIDYGFGGFYLNDDIVYTIGYVGETYVDYMREREREFGIYGILRYPFNKFWRLDWENLVKKIETRRDWLENNQWHEESLPDSFKIQFPEFPVSEDELIYSPQFTLTFDNAIYGNVGPILGWRASLMSSANFSNDKKTYGMIYGDIRKYWLFAKQYSIAVRAFGGWLTGESGNYFTLDEFYDIRGFINTNEYLNSQLEGRKKIVSSFEFRFPLVEHLKIAFPLPLYFHNIRGSAFADIGSVWTTNKNFEFIEKGRLKDAILGFGFGPRINLGFFILKFDVAWRSDLFQTSKPTFYWSLSEDF
ncbi:MAG: hypothetical protein K8S23_16380 [Candidatus Cloacimonetes bacterium]|nr:hypothetical protein [Candidatus Cloacimonadota bacterium]